MNKLIIIKIGSNVIDDETALTAFLKDFAAIQQRKILVHGGGKMATELAERLGIKQQMVDGRRITDGETLRIVTMVYAGYINKYTVARLQANGCNAIGIAGPDGNLILAHKREISDIDYGFAGDIDAINEPLITTLIEQGLTPVIPAISHDQKGQLLNTNADTIAQEIAKSLSRKYETRLIFLFEKPGVLMNEEDDLSVITRINRGQYQQLKEKKIITRGMLPKLDNAFEALDSGVKEVLIGSPAEMQALIAGTAGTTLFNEQ